MKALFSYGTGKHAEYLSIARPFSQAFAKRHGYDYIEARHIGTARPAPWYKVLAMRQLLDDYDEVLFMGADCIIVDGREDLNVPADAWQAMVRHHTGDGDVPNTDFWLTRKPMIPYLEQAWELKQYLYHGWWEQAALLDLMGYKVPQPTTLIAPTELFHRTHFLDNGWNVHIWDRPQPERKRVQHATMWPDRAAIMRQWAQEAQGWVNE